MESKNLISNNAISAIDKERIIEAVIANNSAEIEKIINRFSVEELAKIRFKYLRDNGCAYINSNLFLVACCAGNKELVEKFIEVSVDINELFILQGAEEKIYYRTPLMVAVLSNEQGAIDNILDCKSTNPIVKEVICSVDNEAFKTMPLAEMLHILESIVYKLDDLRIENISDDTKKVIMSIALMIVLYSVFGLLTAKELLNELLKNISYVVILVAILYIVIELLP